MARPQQRPEPQPGLKVVERPPEQAPAAQDHGKPLAPDDAQALADKAREAEAARRRLHPPRVWPD